MPKFIRELSRLYEGLCIAFISTLVLMQIKTIWSVLLRNFEFEMVDPFPEPDLDSMVVGPKPCRVHYRRRTTPL